MRSPTLLLIRMNAAETSASRAMADWTPLTVVFRSATTAEIDTFISDVSTTSTNIAIASRIARRGFHSPAAGAVRAAVVAVKGRLLLRRPVDRAGESFWRGIDRAIT